MTCSTWLWYKPCFEHLTKSSHIYRAELIIQTNHHKWIINRSCFRQLLFGPSLWHFSNKRRNGIAGSWDHGVALHYLPAKLRGWALQAHQVMLKQKWGFWLGSKGSTTTVIKNDSHLDRFFHIKRQKTNCWKNSWFMVWICLNHITRLDHDLYISPDCVTIWLSPSKWTRSVHMKHLSTYPRPKRKHDIVNVWTCFWQVTLVTLGSPDRNQFIPEEMSLKRNW